LSPVVLSRRTLSLRHVYLHRLCPVSRSFLLSCLFLFYDPPTTSTYTLSLHDALPISAYEVHTGFLFSTKAAIPSRPSGGNGSLRDRKSTRLNSSHEWISYAVFCLKKKKKN